MWKKIKKFFTIYSDDPKKVIEIVLQRGVNWYDYEKLPQGDQINYYNSIQQAVRNEALMNEINHLLSDWVEEIAMSEENYNRDKQLRYSINALKLLKERLEGIPDPTKQVPTTDDLYDVI